MMAKITIIYDSITGNTKRMAEEVYKGANHVGGLDIVLKHVDEASGLDLLSEGLIIGSPTHCGVISWKLKKFFDENTRVAWGKVGGYIATAFSSSGGLGGGNEVTLLSILSILMNYGYLVFGLPDYAAPGVTGHYGAVSVRNPDEKELKQCYLLGVRIAEYVKKFHS